MGAKFSLAAHDLDALQQAMVAYEGDTERAINEVLHNEAGSLIYEEINPLINPSGRTFKGHSSSATVSAWPFYDTTKNLAVTVRTKAKWDYLYFPDDGSNTGTHAGNQRFFERGGEKAVPEVAERCMSALTDLWEG